ncbi:hypothetical protein N8I84_41405 (plasmid) [Streptomyces cynarae]|uniref:Uncharacterized protein n=1 Tax=Streptomyces cynarae TaxID=2981134 RepID=A0ABY6EDY0_9ACTN|nr:hypothetical protein [Streptomyces cynarae]UXY24907.1 hypothetical protein N8I84_41405 [Streptomyces cynarae]
MTSRRVDNDPEAVEEAIIDLVAVQAELAVGPELIGSVAALLPAMLLAEGFPVVHVPGPAVNRAPPGIPGAVRTSPIPATSRSSPNRSCSATTCGRWELPDGAAAELRLLVSPRHAHNT